MGVGVGVASSSRQSRRAERSGAAAEGTAGRGRGTTAICMYSRFHVIRTTVASRDRQGTARCSYNETFYGRSPFPACEFQFFFYRITTLLTLFDTNSSKFISFF